MGLVRAVSLKPADIPLLALTDEPMVLTRRKGTFCPSAANVPTENPVPDFLSPQSTDPGSKESLCLKGGQVPGMSPLRLH